MNPLPEPSRGARRSSRGSRRHRREPVAACRATAASTLTTARVEPRGDGGEIDGHAGGAPHGASASGRQTLERCRRRPARQRWRRRADRRGCGPGGHEPEQKADDAVRPTRPDSRYDGLIQVRSIRLHYKGQKLRPHRARGTPSARALSSLLPASAPDHERTWSSRLTEPPTLPPSRSIASAAASRRHRRRACR